MWGELIVFYGLKCSFTIMLHSSVGENTCKDNPVAFLKINNATVLHSVFFIKPKLDSVLLRRITSDAFFLEMLASHLTCKKIHSH